MKAITKTLILLSLSFIGGLSANAVGMPSGWLIGSMLLAFIASIAKAPVCYPDSLQSLTVFIIATNVGSMVDGELIYKSYILLPSLLGMFMSLVISTIVSAFVLNKYSNLSHYGAFLSSYPGHLVMIIKMSRNSTELPYITLMHSFRVLFLVAFIPAVLSGLWTNNAALFNGSFYVHNIPATLALSIAGLFLAKRINAPAPIMIGPLAGSSLASVLGFSIGQQPLFLEISLLVLTGALVGSRFDNFSIKDLLSLFPFSLISISIFIAITYFVAYPISKIINIPMGQLMLSYAPGGVEVMSIIAFSYGYDPAFVSVHHVFRLIIMAMLIPFSFSYFNRN